MIAIITTMVYDIGIMAKRMAVNTKNKTSRSKKTTKRLAIKNARIANRKRKNL